MGICLIAIIFIYAIANYFKPFEKINNLNSLYGEVKILVIDNQEFRDLNKNGVLDKYEDQRLAADIRSDDLLSKMTIDEKIGQMFHPPFILKPDLFMFLYAVSYTHLTLPTNREV